MAGSGGSPGRIFFGFAKPTTSGRLAGPCSRVRPSCASIAASAVARKKCVVNDRVWVVIVHAADRDIAAFSIAGSRRGGTGYILYGMCLINRIASWREIQIQKDFTMNGLDRAPDTSSNGTAGVREVRGTLPGQL